MMTKLSFFSVLLTTTFMNNDVFASVIFQNEIYKEEVTINGQSDVRGGAFEFRKGAVFEKAATFTNNFTTGSTPNNGYGGAVFITSGSSVSNPVVFNDIATFSGNKAVAGGAVYNQGDLQFDLNVNFNNNYAKSGGAVLNSTNANILFKGETIFKGNGINGNDITETGGALYNGGTVIFEKLATFTENQSTNQGSSISNLGTITFQNGLTATNNIGTLTGIYNSGTLNVTGGDVQILNNTTNRAAGIMNNGFVNFTNVDTITFANNAATGSSAGALSVNDSGAGVFLSADTITFDGNTSTGNGYGGAIFSAGNLSILGENNTFTNNVYTAQNYGDNNENYYGGGAIHVRANANIADAKLIIGNDKSNNLFSKNTSNKQGGALFARAGADAVVNGQTTFTQNTAASYGGAIYVRDDTSKITFNGSVVFSENKDKTGLNDIYNAGTIIFNNDVTLDGGITGSDTGKVIFAKGINLNVKANETFIENIVENNGATLNINLENGYTGIYELVKNSTFTDDSSDFIIAKNALYNIKSTDAKGKYDISKKSGKEIASQIGASQNQANTIVAITNGLGNNETFNKISNTINDLMQSGNQNDINTVLKASQILAPAVSPIILQTTIENTQQIYNLISSRLIGTATPKVKCLSCAKNMCDSATVWMQGLHNYSKLEDRNAAKGFQANKTGVSFGIEKQINYNIKTGLGYAYIQTDVDGYNRELDINTHTALLYGEYNKNAWFINAIASYSWSDNNEQKNVLGYKITSDFDTQSYGVQFNLGRNFIYKNFIFTPETGLRYINVSHNGYKDTIDQYIYDTQYDTLIAIAGLRAKQTYKLKNGFTLQPSVRLAYTYDITDDNVNTTAMLANGSVYTIKGKPLKRHGVETDIDLTATITNNAFISLGYQGWFRNHYQSHAGTLNFKYYF